MIALKNFAQPKTLAMESFAFVKLQAVELTLEEKGSVFSCQLKKFSGHFFSLFAFFIFSRIGRIHEICAFYFTTF